MEKVVKHTWLLHSVSPVTYPLQKEALDDNLTQFLRRSMNAESSARTTWFQADTGRRRKRHHDDGNVQTDQPEQYLRFQIISKESIAAEVFLCNSLALARGNTKAYSLVLDWLQTTAGCYIHKTGPTAAEMALLLSTLEHQRSGGLALTFQTPFANEGLETISINIPSDSLSSLLRDIEASRPDHFTDKIIGLPVLKALHYYIYEAFQMKVEAFPFIKASNGYCSLGTDGKVKFKNVEAATLVLSQLRQILQTRTNDFVPSDDTGPTT